jgi:hypothetical protein
LTLTVQGKQTIMALISTKLFCSDYHCQSLTITYKNSAIAWSYEYHTVLTIVYVYVGSHIKHEKLAISTILYVKLLLFYRSYLFNSKSTGFISKSIILGIVFFFNDLWFENVSMKFWLLLCGFLIFDNLRNVSFFLYFSIT